MNTHTEYLNGFFAMYSFLEVLAKNRNHLTISYGGNMGASMDRVNNCLEAIGLPNVNWFKKNFPDCKEYGYPDYLWTLDIDCNKEFITAMYQRIIEKRVDCIASIDVDYNADVAYICDNNLPMDKINMIRCHNCDDVFSVLQQQTDGRIVERTTISYCPNCGEPLIINKNS